MAEDNNMNTENKNKPRWMVALFIAITMLIIVFGIAFLVSGKEIIERPILVFFILFAWLGALVGINI